MAGPLEGMRVIDWTVWQQGPVAGAMLGDLGADVIKIEEKDGGDFGRAMYAINGMSTANQPNAYFEVNNRNKKSVAINLKTAKGREIMHKLIAGADIFLHNYRPGVPEKLGLDYETLKAINPQLIYAAASAYGANGPDGTARAYDTLGSARSGISWAMTREGTDVPVSPPGAMADQMGAIMLAYGVLAAVAARYRHGVGQKVDTSLLGSMMWLQGLQFAMQLIMGFSLSGRERPRDVLNPLFTHYRCADGKWIALAMLQSDKYWADFAEAMQAPALIDADLYPDHVTRLRNGNSCHAILEQAFGSRDREYWLDRLGKRADFPVCAVNSIEDAVNDPQSEANQYVIPFDHPERGPMRMPGFPILLSETPAAVRMRAPELGEHTEEVLISALGMTWDDFEPLRRQGVI